MVNEAWRAAKNHDDRPALAALLALKLRGRFIDADEARSMMRGAEYRTEPKMQIRIEGEWLKVCRTDLCGECPTYSHRLRDLQSWVDCVQLGAVISQHDFFIVDSWSDG
jgi:hypothetical protein